MTTTPHPSEASSAEQVRQLFNPRSIALIGATDKSRWSWNTWGNLVTHRFAGPAVVEQMDATTVVPPGMTARVDQFLNLILDVA